MPLSCSSSYIVSTESNEYFRSSNLGLSGFFTFAGARALQSQIILGFSLPASGDLEVLVPLT